MKKHIAFLLISSVIVLLTNCSSDKTKYGYINTKGEWVIKQRLTMPLVENPRNFSEGLVVIKLKNKYGYMDTSGKIVVKPQYDYAEDFSEGLAAVAKNNEVGIPRWGFIDKTGEIVFPLSYVDAHSFSEELAHISTIGYKDDKPVKYIDHNGTIHIETDKTAGDFHEGLAYININGRYGYMDYAGKVVIEPQYIKAGNFSEGIAKVLLKSDKGDKWGYINKQGELIIEPQYENADDFSEGLACVLYNGKRGHINKEGTFIVPPEYFNGYLPNGNFSNGIAAIVKDLKTYFVDKNGDFLFSSPYDFGGDFSEGLAYAELAGKIGYIDTNGNFAFTITGDFLDFGEFHEGLAYVGK